MISINKTDEGYSFERIDDDGEAWNLGHANLGEDEIYDGYFDTKRITFEDLDQCIRLIMERKPGEDIVYNREYMIYFGMREWER